MSAYNKSFNRDWPTAWFLTLACNLWVVHCFNSMLANPLTQSLGCKNMINKYSGMTLNERLYEAKLFSEFDNAAINRDGEEMIRILTNVELTITQAHETTDSIIDNPSKYGY